MDPITLITLTLARTTHNHHAEAKGLYYLGDVYLYQGNYPSARQHCERALAIQQEIGDRRGAGYSLTYLGHALAGLGDLEAAAKVYDDALRLRRELGQNALAMDDLAGLAWVALAQGQRGRGMSASSPRSPVSFITPLSSSPRAG
jgi:tetratricopeptide (TPR) repeat protein